MTYPYRCNQAEEDAIAGADLATEITRRFSVSHLQEDDKVPILLLVGDILVIVTNTSL